MSVMDEIKATFFQECDEQLAAFEENLSALRDGNAGPDSVNAVFRAVHSIKGGAGAFGFDRLVDFAHAAETLLDDLRSDRAPVTPATIAVLFRAGDVISDFVMAARNNVQAVEGLGEDVLQAMKGPLDDASVTESAPAAIAAAPAAEPPAAPDDGFEGLDFTPVQISLDEPPAVPTPAGPAGYRIHFAPRATIYRNANEPLLLFRELAQLGDLTIDTELDTLSELIGFEPDGLKVSWELTLTGDVKRAAIDEIFEFIQDECSLTVEPLGAGDAGKPAGRPSLAIAPEAAAPSKQKSAPSSPGVAQSPTAVPLPASSPAGTEGTSPLAAVSSLPRGGGAPTPAKPDRAVETNATIRVELEKVDRLVNAVGEIVITQSMLARFAEPGTDCRPEDFRSGLDELTRHVRNLQDSVMDMRTHPVKAIFQRMPRIVREVAAQTGKQVRLSTRGEGTEVDMSIIERLADPLVHMIRNAVDHGIETPDQRVAAGKNPEGHVVLSAETRSGRIVIEIADDGRGIDRGRVRAKAEAKGLIAPDAELTDEELDNLIFLPGLSTAATVSNISGRGVGMDVVLSNIRSIGGRVSIASKPGEGSRFTMILPLTLAVLDGMLVAVGPETYIIPRPHIIECLRPLPRDVHHGLGGTELLYIRGAHVPIVYVHRKLGVEGAIERCTEGVVVMVEAQDNQRIGLAVDTLIGQQQVVIKSIEEAFGAMQGIAGATILGDGRVALILDVEGLAPRDASRARVA